MSSSSSALLSLPTEIRLKILYEVVAIYRQSQPVTILRYDDQARCLIGDGCVGIGNLLLINKQIQQEVEPVIYKGCSLSLDLTIPSSPEKTSQVAQISASLDRYDKLRRMVARVRLSLEWLRATRGLMISELFNQMEALQELQLDSGVWYGDSEDYEEDIKYAWNLIAATTVRDVTILTDIPEWASNEFEVEEKYTHPKIGLLKCGTVEIQPDWAELGNGAALRGRDILRIRLPASRIESCRGNKVYEPDEETARLWKLKEAETGSFRVSDPAFIARVLSAVKARLGAVAWARRKEMSD